MVIPVNNDATYHGFRKRHIGTVQEFALCEHEQNAIAEGGDSSSKPLLSWLNRLVKPYMNAEALKQEESTKQHYE